MTKYVVKKVITGEWAVINSQTGDGQSFWTVRSEALEAAKILNKRRI